MEKTTLPNNIDTEALKIIKVVSENINAIADGWRLLTSTIENLNAEIKLLKEKSLMNLEN